MNVKKSIAISGIIIILFTIFLYSHLEQTFPLSPYIDTKFASGFTWEKFNSIKKGMSKVEVEKILDKPLSRRITSYPDPNECWQYSADDKLAPFADFSWFSAQVCYTKEKVSSKPVNEFGD